LRDSEFRIGLHDSRFALIESRRPHIPPAPRAPLETPACDGHVGGRGGRGSSPSEGCNADSPCLWCVKEHISPAAYVTATPGCMGGTGLAIRRRISQAGRGRRPWVACYDWRLASLVFDDGFAWMPGEVWSTNVRLQFWPTGGTTELRYVSILTSTSKATPSSWESLQTSCQPHRA
jgi:hypothetical protein